MTTEALREIFLNFIYCVPSHWHADERYFHEDIAAMSELERRREGERARFRLLFDPKPHPWLVQRIDELTRSATNAN